MTIIGLYIRLIFALGILVLGLSIYLVIQRYLYFRRVGIKKKAHDRLNPLVLRLTYGNVTLEEFKAHLNLKVDLRFLKAILASYISRVRGVPGDRLMQAYKELGYFDGDIRDVRSGKWWRQARGAHNMGMLQKPESIPYLVSLIDHRRLDVRLMAGYALGRLGDVRAIQPLLQETAQANVWIRIRLLEVVQNMRDKALPALRKTLRESATPEILALCIETLGQSKDEQSAPLIMEFCTHPDMEVSLKAIKALGEIRYLPALELLMDLLKDERWQIKALACKSLGNMGDVRAVDGLSEKLGDAHWWVRSNAAGAMARLELEGVRKLLEAARSDPDRFARDAARQALEELALSE